MIIKEAWHEIWEKSRFRGDGDEILDEILEGYRERAYHNEEHIKSMMREFWLTDLKNLVKNRRAMVFSIVFHDAVYDPKRRDNEKKSARLALELLAKAGVPKIITSQVEKNILATTHLYVPRSQDAKMQCDLDLISLSGSFDSFLENIKNLKKEYSELDPEQFSDVINSFFNRLMERASIYLTKKINSRCEKMARHNIRIVQEKIKNEDYRFLK